MTLWMHLHASSNAGAMLHCYRCSSTAFFLDQECMASVRCTDIGSSRLFVCLQ
jgi:hypothetical protein